MLLPSLLSVIFIQRNGYVYEVYLLWYFLRYLLPSYVNSKLYLVETLFLADSKKNISLHSVGTFVIYLLNKFYVPRRNQ